MKELGNTVYNVRPREKIYYEIIENNQLHSINKNERWKDGETDITITCY
jgi:hypothetical protein